MKVRSSADAIAAVREAMRLAYSEDPPHRATYLAVGQTATGWGSLDIPLILGTGVKQLAYAPKAKKWLQAVAYEYWVNVEQPRAAQAGEVVPVAPAQAASGIVDNRRSRATGFARGLLSVLQSLQAGRAPTTTATINPDYTPPGEQEQLAPQRPAWVAPVAVGGGFVLLALLIVLAGRRQR